MSTAELNYLLDGTYRKKSSELQKDKRTKSSWRGSTKVIYKHVERYRVVPMVRFKACQQRIAYTLSH